MTAPTTSTAGPGSGETVDPEQGKAFADQLAAVFQKAHDECETSIATLTEHGVTGGPIAKLTAIQEKAAEAVGEAQEASRYFAAHIDAADQAQAAQQQSGAGGGRYLGVGA